MAMFRSTWNVAPPKQAPPAGGPPPRLRFDAVADRSGPFSRSVFHVKHQRMGLRGESSAGQDRSGDAKRFWSFEATIID